MLMKPAARYRRLSIGDVTRIFDMTPRAVRLYEEKGLFEAGRDRLNCRYYDGEAAARLELISELRTAGLGLAEIRDVFEAEEEDANGARVATDRLAERRRRLVEELALVDAVSARLGGEPAASNDPGEASVSRRRLKAL